MKNLLKGIAALTLALTLSTGNANALTESRKIDASVCDTVYTNYYFFLEANTNDYFNQSELSKIRHISMAEFKNNSYQISNFNLSNIGYGEVTINPNSRTSVDGITSMSLDDFYGYLQQSYRTNGAFSIGTTNYIVSHDWYSVNTDGSLGQKTNTLDLSSYSIDRLKAATLVANTSISRLTTVSNFTMNPFMVKVDRQYYGYLTGMPITNGNYQWYLHPAVYYVQYCADKVVETPVETYYTVHYETNTTDAVANMPNDTTENTKNDTTIATNVPVRNGWTFLGWNTDSSSPVENAAYKGGSPYTDRKDLTLYAIWQKNPEQVLPENPQTGVEDYLLPFGGVVTVSGLALNILKKKKGFKQF